MTRSDPKPTGRRFLGIASILALLLLPIFLAACSGKSEEVDPSNPERTSMRVALDWYANPDHAGFLVTRDRGFFESAGLDVALETPTDPALPIKQVAAGEVDLAISYAPEVLLARERGSDVVAVAAIVDRPLTSMIWLKKSGVKSVRDLEGKTVSTAGIPYQQAYLDTILERAGLGPDSVKRVGVGQGLSASILGGRAAATLGPFWNIEGVDLRISGKKPVVNPVDRLGIPTYDELVLVANGDALAADPQPICLFLAALARGTAEAVGRPNLAVGSVIEANPALAKEKKTTRAQVEATLPLLEGSQEGESFGYMSLVEWQQFINWSFENGVLEESQRAVDAVSDDYLPGRCPTAN
jgi:putative hydroxymethylpyrimidine transport system substrate-binding protein